MMNKKKRKKEHSIDNYDKYLYDCSNSNEINLEYLKDISEFNDIRDDHSYIVCKKNSFKNIIDSKKVQKLNDFMNIIMDVTNKTNKIVFHTYNFLKLYLLHLLDNDKGFPFGKNIYPIINVQFIRNIMNVITYKNEKRGKEGLINDSIESMKDFYEKHYKPLLSTDDIICRDGLQRLLHYEEIDIIKNIEVNISQHFMSHLRFFIKVKYGFDKLLTKITNNKKMSEKEKKEKRHEIHLQINNIVFDIIEISGRDYVSDPKYHHDIFLYKCILIPQKNIFKKNNIPYDVKANSMDYIIQMIYLNRELYKINKKIIENHKDIKKDPPVYKLFNALPLRTKIIPKYITLDTVALVSLFVTENVFKYTKKSKLYGDEIWNKFFKMNTRLFRRKGYKFHHSIKTDGISCSILFEKVDSNGIVLKRPLNFDKCHDPKESKLKYIDDIDLNSSTKEKSIIVCDPGKNDLGTFMDVNEKYFRYTQKQRNHETKKKKYNKIKKSLSDEKINGKTITEIESELTKYNSKSCNYDEFKNYLLEKIKMNKILFDHYNKRIYRKLKWNTYMNTSRSESNMLNKFEQKMGGPDEVVMILGDWSDKGIRGKEPSISKKLRRLFMDRKYECYLVDEFRTSKICSNCALKKPKTLDREYGITSNIEIAGESIWKLIKCKTCKSIHDRDHNATKNMMLLTKEKREGNERPKILSRDKNNNNINEKFMQYFRDGNFKNPIKK
jgi:hypothetical protein